MQAVILAAGKGVRMLPLTQDKPKPLLKIGEKTILDYTLQALPDQITEILVVVGYLQEQIRQYLADYYPNRKFIFVEDVETRGTGYAIKLCPPYLTGEFLALNGDDIYNKSDLEKLQQHRLAFLVKDESKQPDFPEKYLRFGRIVTDKDSNFIELVRDTDSQENLVTMGVYKLNSDFFKYDLVQMKNGEYGLPQTLFAMSPEHPIKAVKADLWLPIGFPEDIKNAEKAINS